MVFISVILVHVHVCLTSRCCCCCWREHSKSADRSAPAASPACLGPTLHPYISFDYINLTVFLRELARKLSRRVPLIDDDPLDLVLSQVDVNEEERSLFFKARLVHFVFHVEVDSLAIFEGSVGTMALGPLVVLCVLSLEWLREELI